MTVIDSMEMAKSKLIAFAVIGFFSSLSFASRWLRVESCHLDKNVFARITYLYDYTTANHRTNRKFKVFSCVHTGNWLPRVPLVTRFDLFSVHLRITPNWNYIFVVRKCFTGITPTPSLPSAFTFLSLRRPPPIFN